MGRTLWPASLAAACFATGLHCSVAAADSNPLLGTWALSDVGWGGCAEQRGFTADHQTWLWKGSPSDAPATYFVEGNKVYVQQRWGSGGTEAFIIVGPNEIMQTIGYKACHWTRQ